jgi:hypothetical protein
MKTTRKYYTTEYKKKIVAEFEAGTLPAEAIAEREGIERALRPLLELLTSSAMVAEGLQVRP